MLIEIEDTLIDDLRYFNYKFIEFLRHYTLANFITRHNFKMYIRVGVLDKYQVFGVHSQIYIILIGE